jgi:DNA replication protein DnaC
MAYLRELHLPTFRECFEELARRALQETSSYEQYLLELAERECQARLAKRTERLLRDSRLPLEKNLASFDLGRLPAKVSRQVRTLIEGSFVDHRENLLLFGKTGTGKTHLLSAIAQELVVRGGRKVVSWPCALLVQELLVAKRDLKLKRVLKQMSKFEVLLIDDIGYVQQSREEMEVLFMGAGLRTAVISGCSAAEVELSCYRILRGFFRACFLSTPASRQGKGILPWSPSGQRSTWFVSFPVSFAAAQLAPS